MQITIFGLKKTDIFSIFRKNLKPLNMKTNQSSKDKPVKITPAGSLGLLAFGDIGLRAWRQVKKEFYTKASHEEEE